MNFIKVCALAEEFEKKALEREIEKLAKKKKKKKPEWKDLPEGWKDPKSVKKYWTTLTKDTEHPFSKCVEKMKGKMKNPEAFCAKTKDVATGTTKWRGKKKKTKKKKK